MKKIMFFCLLVILAAMPVQANTKEEVEFSKCTDGDTAHFLIRGKDTTVRFLAINAPEYTKTKEPYGKEASEYVCDILTNANTIELEYDDGSDTLDKYGRTLAWVYADDVLLQRELVQRGLAEVKYIYGDYAYTEELKTLEKEAKKEKLNMWSDGKAAAQEQTDSLQYILGAVGGLILIVFGLFFAKGKRNKERYIRKGVKQIRKKR
ncbi:thermonuclease family protein [[Clostridium] innocuum]|nr:thermonuclease family protein [[Clostridium] innocuum]